MDQTVRDGERNQTKLAFNEIREELIQVEEGNGNLNDAVCDVCLIRTLRSVYVDIALYLCYICNKYLCQDCFKGHESHRFIKKSEKDGQIERFLEAMMHESESEIEEMLDREDVSVVDKVNVKHELDKCDKCYITGLCGLDDTRWVVCDCLNDCIKIFSIGSHILQRYIRFWSDPYGVTEIKVKREPTEQVVIPTTDISVTKPAEPDTQCMLVVTLPRVRRIVFINLTQNPAVISKSINTEKHCYSIDFSGDQIFAVCCDEYCLGPWCVSVMSSDGVPIKTINTDLHTSLSDPYLAVCPGRVYLTDRDNHEVLCMNDLGKLVSHKTIEESRPVGISVDPDTNNVYICAWNHDKLYRLDSRLESFESLFDLESVDSWWPEALWLYRNILYVSHGPWFTHGQFVTVVRVS